MDKLELDWTGERYLSSIQGGIELEHMHRYLIAKKLCYKKVVLDIASGEGYGTNILSEVASSVFGVDISKDAIEFANKNYIKKNLRYVEGDCTKIPFDDNTFDVVVSFETIEHHDKHDEMLSEIKRVLKSNGILIISCPDKLNYSDKPGYSNPYHVKELYVDEFEKLVNNYFKKSKLVSQRVIYASAIIGCEKELFQSGDIHEGFDSDGCGLINPDYHIMIASDQHVPHVPYSFFERPIRESDLCKYLESEIRVWQSKLAHANSVWKSTDSLLKELEHKYEDKLNDEIQQQHKIESLMDEICRVNLVWQSTDNLLSESLEKIKLVQNALDESNAELNELKTWRGVFGLIKTILKNTLKKIVKRNFYLSKCVTKLLELSQRRTLKIIETINECPNSKSILVIERSILTPDKDAGSNMVNIFISTLIDIGYEVSFLPFDMRFDAKYSNLLEGMGVIVLDGRIFSSFQDALESASRKNKYFLTCRPDETQNSIEIIKRTNPFSVLIYVMHDLHYLRQMREAQLENDKRKMLDAKWRKNQEIGLVKRCEHIIVVSENEKNTLIEEIGDPTLTNKITTIPVLAENFTVGLGFNERCGIVFIGGFDHKPNEDAVLYFVEYIFPKILKVIPDIIFHVIGSNPTKSILELASDNVLIHGYVEDLGTLLPSIKISVSPLRYGAGVKGKVITSMSYGLPVVGTSIAFEGIFDNDNSLRMATDDPDDFAQETINLYLNETLWNETSSSLMKLCESKFSKRTAVERFTAILGAAK